MSAGGAPTRHVKLLRTLSATIPFCAPDDYDYIWERVGTYDNRFV
jgi:hypothetical protein